jgi:hypothetical protein
MNLLLVFVIMKNTLEHSQNKINETSKYFKKLTLQTIGASWTT